MRKTPQRENLKSFTARLEAMLAAQEARGESPSIVMAVNPCIDVPDHIQTEILYLLSSYWDLVSGRANYLLADSRLCRAQYLSVSQIDLPRRTVCITVKWERKGPLAFFKRRSQLIKEIRFALQGVKLSDMPGDRMLGLPDRWRIRVEPPEWVDKFGW